MRTLLRTSTFRTAAALTAAVLLGGCKDFLTGGALSNDPNRPTTATVPQYITGIETNLWALLGSDPQRISAILTQQLVGNNAQYLALYYSYVINEGTTGGFYSTLYGGGGLIDIRKVETASATVHDSLTLGIAQVDEALLMGTGADLFGDIVYSKAYTGPNPALDPQLAVYDTVQAVLSRAIVNLSANGSTNTGPGGADLVYCNGCGAAASTANRTAQRASWIALAHTLKARFYLHTAKVRSNAYAQALPEARQGIMDEAGDYTATYTGNAGEQNLYFQFEANRPGYIIPDTGFVTLLKARNDPRLATYFNQDQTDLSSNLNNATSSQQFVTARENLLIAAEAAYRTGDEATALAALNKEQGIVGVTVTPATTTGSALLKAILDEKYIAQFPNIEVWNDYKRNCYPNLTPKAAGKKIPARLYYDTGERQTNTSIPQPQNQPARNAADPAAATDPFGNACLGQ